MVGSIVCGQIHGSTTDAIPCMDGQIGGEMLISEFCLSCDYYRRQVKYDTDRGTAWEWCCILDECAFDSEEGEEE